MRGKGTEMMGRVTQVACSTFNPLYKPLLKLPVTSTGSALSPFRLCRSYTPLPGLPPHL